LAARVAPQSPQKRLPGKLSAPHLGQWLPSAAPQSPQNLLPAGFSFPQFEQRIASPIRPAIRIPFITLRWSRLARRAKLKCIGAARRSPGCAGSHVGCLMINTKPTVRIIQVAFDGTWLGRANFSRERTRMNVLLKLVDRSNWRTMVRLELKAEQQGFVSPPAWSLARCYVRFFGDEFEHLPHLVYAGEQAVGY
jgi:hypothetical protein